MYVQSQNSLLIQGKEDPLVEQLQEHGRLSWFEVSPPPPICQGALPHTQEPENKSEARATVGAFISAQKFPQPVFFGSFQGVKCERYWQVKGFSPHSCNLPSLYHPLALPQLSSCRPQGRLWGRRGSWEGMPGESRRSKDEP